VSVIRFACGRPRLLGCHANEKQHQTVGRSGLRKFLQVRLCLKGRWGAHVHLARTWMLQGAHNETDDRPRLKRAA
jgi:hypothetical protein